MFTGFQVESQEEEIDKSPYNNNFFNLFQPNCSSPSYISSLDLSDLSSNYITDSRISKSASFEYPTGDTDSDISLDRPQTRRKQLLHKPRLYFLASTLPLTRYPKRSSPVRYHRNVSMLSEATLRKMKARKDNRPLVKDRVAKANVTKAKVTKPDFHPMRERAIQCKRVYSPFNTVNRDNWYWLKQGAPFTNIVKATGYDFTFPMSSHPDAKYVELGRKTGSQAVYLNPYLSLAPELPENPVIDLTTPTVPVFPQQQLFDAGNDNTFLFNEPAMPQQPIPSGPNTSTNTSQPSFEPAMLSKDMTMTKMDTALPPSIEPAILPNDNTIPTMDTATLPTTRPAMLLGGIHSSAVHTSPSSSSSTTNSVTLPTSMSISSTDTTSTPSTKAPTQSDASDQVPSFDTNTDLPFEYNFQLYGDDSEEFSFMNPSNTNFDLDAALKAMDTAAPGTEQQHLTEPSTETATVSDEPSYVPFESSAEEEQTHTTSATGSTPATTTEASDEPLDMFAEHVQALIASMADPETPVPSSSPPTSQVSSSVISSSPPTNQASPFAETDSSSPVPIEKPPNNDLVREPTPAPFDIDDSPLTNPNNSHNSTSMEIYLPFDITTNTGLELTTHSNEGQQEGNHAYADLNFNTTGDGINWDKYVLPGFEGEMEMEMFPGCEM